jgi:hypothetical protein
LVSARQATANGHRPEPPHRPVNWAAQYQPGPNTRLLHCGAPGCGAAYLDDSPGHQAHIAVFAHSPRPRQPASQPQEDPS